MTATAEEARGALLLALRGGGIRDLGILRAIEAVSRETFMPESLRHLAGRAVAVPIACGQTMPSPLDLAHMLEALAARPEDRVLEIGTGSGYSTAVLAQLSRKVVSFERYRTLATQAENRLRALGGAVRIVVGDGLACPAEFGQFDRIIVHGALTHIPRSLDDALTHDGRIVAGVPVGERGPASLAAFEREGDAFACRKLMPMQLAPIARATALAL